MSELPRLLSNETINLKSINFSRKNKYPSKEKNNFNNNLIKSYIILFKL